MMPEALRRAWATFVFVSLCVFGLSAAAGAETWVSYEPATVTLTGKISRRVFPGPPNYESVKKGDAPEVAWLLRLERPVSVKAKQGDEFNQTRRNVRDLQLALGPDDFKRYRSLLGKRVAVSGQLFGAHTGHHHTAVLLQVKSLKTADRK